VPRLLFLEPTGGEAVLDPRVPALGYREADLRVRGAVMTRSKRFADLLGDPYSTRVPDGQYRVGYLGFERGVAYGRERWFAWFKITEDGPHFGKPILRFYNAPTRAWTARSSNLAVDFIRLTGLRPPLRLKPDLFLKGTEVLAEIIGVREANDGRRKIVVQEDAGYSKIDRLIRITAGSPPCLQVRGKKEVEG
jgi:hypothetical protein